MPSLPGVTFTLIQMPTSSYIRDLAMMPQGFRSSTTDLHHAHDSKNESNLAEETTRSCSFLHQAEMQEASVYISSALNAEDDGIERTPTAFDSTQLKQHLVKMTSVNLKRLRHQPGRKTISEIKEYLPDETAAIALFDGIKPSANTSKLVTWNLSGNEEVNSWLQKKDKYIHPVESGDWCVWWGAAYNPTYAWAKFDSCEAKFDKEEKSLTLTFKTVLYATGRDEEGKPSLRVQ